MSLYIVWGLHMLVGLYFCSTVCSTVCGVMSYIIVHFVDQRNWCCIDEGEGVGMAVDVTLVVYDILCDTFFQGCQDMI